MIPIQLSLAGFLSYRDPVEIDFTTLDLACIAGANGAGKSSILDAITWVLFGQARKRDDSIINLQSEAAEVTFIFEYEQNRYRVRRINPRDKTSLLEFNIAQANQASEHPDDASWKSLSERTIRATQERIEETLRLNYDTFVNAAFFLQGKADQFTQQRPGDRKAILAQILGLEIWETYRERTVARRKTIQTEIAALDGRLAEINAELAEEQTRKTRLTELETELKRLTEARSQQELILENIKKINASLNEQRKLVDTLGNGLETAQTRLDTAQNRLAERQAEAASHTGLLSRQNEIQAAYKNWLAERESLARWDEIAAAFREQDQQRQPLLTEIETERARLLLEQETLQKKQTEIETQAASIPELQAQIQAIETEIAATSAQIQTRKTREAELVEAQQALANASAENPRLKTEMERLKKRIDQLTATEGAACPLCGQPLSETERDQLIAELNIDGKAQGDQYRANQKILSEAHHLVQDLHAQINQLLPLDEVVLEQHKTQTQLNDQIAAIETTRQNWENETQPRLDEISAALKTGQFAPTARAALEKMDAKLKTIGYDAQAHDQARKAVHNGSLIEADFRKLELAQAALEPLQNEIDDLQTQIETAQTEIQQQQDEYQQALHQFETTQAQAPNLQKAQSNLLTIQEQENRLRLEVGMAQNRVSVLDTLRTRRTKLETERENQAQTLRQLKQIERAFGKDGIPALLIEQALPQIEAKANDILARLSNGAMTVRFITQKAYKDKKRDDLRETLEIQISDNAGIRDYEMFSGGEAFRVNFAIRLALSEVLAQRAGARLQTLVIDEGFGSQDEVGRQRLVEAINTVKSDFAKILVITHIEALKDAFPARLEVIKTPRGSTVTVI